MDEEAEVVDPDDASVLDLGASDVARLAMGDQMLADLRSPIVVLGTLFRMCLEVGLPKDVASELVVRFASNTLPGAFCEAEKVFVGGEAIEEGE